MASKYTKGKDGNYRASIVIGRTEDGGQRRKTVKAKTVRELEKKLTDIKIQFDRGIDFDASKVTVKQWAERWFITYKAKSVGASTQSNIRSILNKHIYPSIGNVPVGDVKAFKLQEIMNAQNGTSQSQAVKIMAVIKQIFSRAQQSGLIYDTPAEHIELPRTTSKPRRALTSEERNAVIKLCDTHRAGTWVLLMLMCGLRKGETIPLTFADIDFSMGMLSVNKSVEFINNIAHVKTTKTKSGVRVIPVPPPLLVKLRAEKREGLIFTPAKSDKMLTETNCKRLWNSFYRELDIAMGAKLYRNKIIETSLDDGICPHALRHTYATDLFHHMKIDIRTAQHLLGHADIKTTSKYTHFRNEMMAETQKKFDAFYNEGNERGTEQTLKIV